MINIDTRLLKSIAPDELYLLCHIVNFMNENRMCFPSNKRLSIESKFSESKILRVKNELVLKKIISVQNRFRPDGSQTSNLYKIESEYIGVFITGKKMSDLNTPIFTDEGGWVFTHEGGTPSVMNTHEVLTNISINQNKVLESSENEFSHTHEEIKNSFLSHSDSDPLDTDKVKKKEKLREKKEKAEPKPPSDIYLAYEMFCTFHESVSASKYPRYFNGNLILNQIDARNIKLLLDWVAKIDPDNKMDNFKVFIQAAWMLDDKYLQTNFSIGLLYRQCSQIYAKVQNTNPILSKQRKEEQRNAEAAEFLRERYGIVN